MKQKGKPFSLKARMASFSFAFRGLRDLAKHEHNFRIHLAAAIMAIILGFVLHITAIEWMVLFILIFLVLISEALNSALERLADVISPGKNENVRKLKDYSAAAVLMASMAALAGGLLIFLPKLLFWIREAGA